MIRFVDLTEALDAGPACALLDTVDDRFEQRSDGSHVLESLDDVREAAGERGVALVPAGFFDDRATKPQTRTSALIYVRASWRRELSRFWLWAPRSLHFWRREKWRLSR